MMKITEVGLTLEAITSLDEFTEERYNDIARQKMGFYLFNFTTTMGTLLAERQDLMISDIAGRVFEQLAILYTIQNDYMDCYGENITGKKGADIQEGQCTWLIISALKRATITQKHILKNSYGSHNANDVNKVKKIYDELGIRNEYEATVSECFQRTTTEIDNICNEDVRKFCEMLVKIFFRID
ncbi:hypothetical protein WA026_015713 [Henosepilachna vigintioctopunctata]|uniref:Farnesyl pyrophosphate synthase n=1 Tax=Henosepilachna vigintioctopunctata TaxID=420089 RepID=A0AAW1UZ70_9CUCU